MMNHGQQYVERRCVGRHRRREGGLLHKLAQAGLASALAIAAMASIRDHDPSMPERMPATEECHIEKVNNGDPTQLFKDSEGRLYRRAEVWLSFSGFQRVAELQRDEHNVDLSVTATSKGRAVSHMQASLHHDGASPLVLLYYPPKTGEGTEAVLHMKTPYDSIQCGDKLVFAEYGWQFGGPVEAQLGLEMGRQAAQAPPRA